ncbi:hypothetical protein [Marinitenerispora sediminis]|uniref:Uncharacterized protein n=1 Tax=Marinitenerispora sediminis TaxID=1931232 RepID=A0A368TB46_9ACTN|nr:hypothetical protein [Marinitenerispora sediminis]RCV53655.1 hypothetical protein DEF28_09995 [Marinitenerispora sediminis]RCV57361.1 hypothetical protein DEF23_10885 [Marinitenerispora sediminis]RCV62359.1 hypothetical protein DEF24_01605 [Marinitenerispora sediminis]
MLRELSSAPLAAWGNAWLSGQVGLDDAVDAVERRTGPHVVGALAGADLPFEPGAPLRAALAGLRTAGLSAFRLCLPVPGDPLGLVGTAELNMAAIEAREAVLVRLADRQLGLVPREDRRGSSYVGVSWTPYPAADTVPEYIPLDDAEYRLNLAIRECTALFGRVDDIGSWGPEVTRALAGLRDAGRAPTDGLAPGSPQRAHRVAAMADRLAVVVRLAEEADGRGLSASQMESRRAAVRLLDRAVRRARVAAYTAAVPG